MHQDIVDQINERVVKLRGAADLDPKDIALTIVELSALWANVTKDAIDAECNYKERLKIEKEKYTTSSEAKIYAEASAEYRQYREAEGRLKSLQEVIRSGKKFTNLMESEMREARY